jgi:hypothetical protein
MKIKGHGFDMPRERQFFVRVCDDIERRAPLPQLDIERTFASGVKQHNKPIETLTMIGTEAIGHDFHLTVGVAEDPNLVRVLMLGTKKDGTIGFHTFYDVPPQHVNRVSFDVLQWFYERSGLFEKKTDVERTLAPAFPDLPETYTKKLILQIQEDLEKERMLSSIPSQEKNNDEPSGQ